MRDWFPPRPSRADPGWFERLPGSVRGAILGGAGGGAIACLLLLVALIRGIVMVATGGTIPTAGAARGLLFYVAGFVLGGAVAGALSPLERWIGGVFGLSVVAALIVMMAIVRSDSGPVRSWDSETWVVIVGLAVLFGGAFAAGIQRATRA
jgi:peptidoglycan/LPS O-acetylase OafA/YrhL